MQIKNYNSKSEKKILTLELLSPAKNLESGIAAINAGADAVYIGAHKFGARSNASNSLQDIEKLIKYAHRFRVKIYITLNTILYDNELAEAKNIIHAVYNIGADALIIQDMGILELDIPPMPLIASTQMNNNTLEKIEFLEKIGFQRIILARELSLEEIKNIREQTNIELECFVHGSLCVSYSGQCFFSQAICERSANRGMCAQPCRMTYDLIDNKGKIISKDKYLLSLKDLNLFNHLPDLIAAGITSFKIEGRLKDINYIKNITAFFRKGLDKVISGNDSLKRASFGESIIPFKPDPYKSFNRGFTDYFLDGRRSNLASLDTEKSIGEFIGKVRSVHNNYFILDGKNNLHNGDGICFFDKNDILFGTNINNIDKGKIYPNNIEHITQGVSIYRNYDHAFNKFLNKNEIQRKISLLLIFGETVSGFYISVEDEEGVSVRYEISFNKVIADNPSNSVDTINKQLSKMGESIYRVKNLQINLENIYFIPISILNNMRRQAIEILEKEREKRYIRKTSKIISNDAAYPDKELYYPANVSNHKAKEFYERHGAVIKEYAFELASQEKGKTLMTTKYCIKYQLGFCPLKEKNISNEIQEPLYLMNNGKRYRLGFNCKDCVMYILK